MIQRLRHLICQFILIIAAIVLSACATRQEAHSGSTAIPTSGSSNFRASRTAFATRVQTVDPKAITPIPTLSMTPTLNVKDPNNSWVRFYDHVYGITIEYPSIYSDKPYQVVCDPYETRDGIHFGANSKVFIRQQLGTSLDEHIAAFIPYYHSDEQFKLVSQEAVQVNNQPAIAIKYKLGDTTENRELVFVTAPESKIIYTFSFIDGSACDVPELGLTERIVFEHALETFYVAK